MNKNEIVAKCHDIQVSLGMKEVPDYEKIPMIGMMVNLAIHLRGLPQINYNVLRLVASEYLGIHSMIVRELVLNLAEIEFVIIDKEGDTIKSIVPTVPYFDDVYSIVGEFAFSKGNLNEVEQVAIEILKRVNSSPISYSSVYEMGADRFSVDRNIQIGTEGGYLVNRRARGKDILLSPNYFAENADLYSDLVAKKGAKSVKRLLELIKSAQGWPLSIIEKTMEINGTKITEDELGLLKRIAQDGAIKPPSINTPHSGTNFFLFTPSPGASILNPTKKEIYERALALVSSVRQGQFLADRYRIKMPVALLRSLKNKGYINANTEALDQYKMLTVNRVGFLENVGNGWHRFRLHDIEENIEALDTAIHLLSSGIISGLEVNQDARFALQKDQSYIESIISSHKLREKENVMLSEEHQLEIDALLLEGSIK